MTAHGLSMSEMTCPGGPHAPKTCFTANSVKLGAMLETFTDRGRLMMTPWDPMWTLAGSGSSHRFGRSRVCIGWSTPAVLPAVVGTSTRPMYVCTDPGTTIRSNQDLVCTQVSVRTLRC